ncbi:MAG TPA: SGNH/GDSL hydrolase family protein [Rectinemataceae bacterium]
MIYDCVYLFGDSVARGIILDENGNYTPTQESFALLAARKLGVDLVNKARFGCTISKGLEIMLRWLSCERVHVRAAGSEALAILEFGGNDCDFLWDQVAARPEAEHLPATPLGTFSALYAQMIDTLRSNGFRPAIMSLPPLVADRYLQWITRTGLDRSAIVSWLGDVQQIFRWHESYDQAVRKIAESKSCPLLDIRKAFLEKPDYRRFMCQDGIHPNREGHRLIEAYLETYASGS